MDLPEEAEEKLLLRTTGGLSFFNISKMDLSKLGESSIKDNLESYIQGFSKDGREIFEYFNFGEFIGQLLRAGRPNPRIGPRDKSAGRVFARLFDRS